MHALVRDLSVGMRNLARRPAFAAAALLTLALGLGAFVAVLSVADGLLFRSLPFREPSRLAMIWSAFPAQDNPRFSISAAEFLDLRRDSTSFASMGLWGASRVTVTGDAAAERCVAGVVNRELFDTLGAPVLLGRGFSVAEDSPGGPLAVVLTHSLWQRRYGGDPGVVQGGSVEVDGVSVPIVGVLPRWFELPTGEADLFAPAQLDRSAIVNRSGHNFNAIGRLAAGRTMESANAELAGLLRRWQVDYADRHPNDPVEHPLVLVPLEEQLLAPVRPMVSALLGAVGLVLLLAAANVTNLLLARGVDRRREMEIRSALGAGRGELLRQLLAECLVLAAPGALLGVGVGWASLRLLSTFGGPDPVSSPTALTPFVLAWTALAGLLIAGLFGVLPAIQAVGWGRRWTVVTGRAASRQRSLRVLVVVQTGIAALLLIGAGLLLESARRLQAVDPGFVTAGKIGFSLQLMRSRYPERRDLVATQLRIEESLRAIPGVREVAMARGLPMRHWLGTEGFSVVGRELQPGEARPSVELQYTSPGYHAALGAPIVDGRGFAASDDGSAPLVAMINEAAARAYFPEESSVGQRIALAFAPADWPSVTIVGVAADVHQRSLSRVPRPELYLPAAQLPAGWAVGLLESPEVLLVSDLPLESIAAPIRRAVAEIDPQVPVSDLEPLAESVSRTVGRERLLGILVGAFAFLAITIAAVGVYGVLAFSVSRRASELGVRLALGARPRRLVGWILGQALRLGGTGAALGALAAWLAAERISALLFQVAPRELAIYGASVLLLVAVVSVAALLPARRAAATSPMQALRQR